MKAITDMPFELARTRALIRLGDAVRELLGEITKSIEAQTACLERKARASAKAGVLMLLVGAVMACSGSRPAPKPPANPAPTVTSSPAPSPDAPATPRPPRPDDPSEPDGGTPLPPKPEESPKAHETVTICHIQEDGEGLTLRVREGTVDDRGTARWHLHAHRGRKDYRGECRKRELRDVVQEP